MRARRLRARLSGWMAGGVAALGLATPVSATWSICVVDLTTGEVAVATATCLENDDLGRFVPMLLVGKGAGAEQSVVDASGFNRILMRDLMLVDTPPLVVLDTLLESGTAPISKQYGIAGFNGFPASFSGAVTSDALGNVTGIVGDLAYAIQGNVLTGPEVCFAAEEALISTPGDLGQRLLAAMEAAYALGGDGRCSCSESDPTGCGVPPQSFTKTAHVGLLYVARIGDTDGACDSLVGCAAGDYYLRLDIIDDSSGLDPVLQLRAQYDVWRAALAGRPDALLSDVAVAADSIPADGLTTTRFELGLRDVDGAALGTGGADVSVTPAPGSPGDVAVGGVFDAGDGTYSFELTAGTTVGTVDLVVVVDDGVRPVTLYPYPSVRVDPVAPLHVGFDTVAAGAGATVPFVLDEPAAANGMHLLLASLSGTSPGTPVGNLIVPLNRDAAFDWTLASASGPNLPGSFGSPDANGRAALAFVAPPGFLGALVGARVDWAALWLGAGGLGVTPPVGFDIVP